MATVQDSDFDSLVPGLPLSRRTFVGGSLAAGFALAVQPALGQSVVVTPADGLVAGDRAAGAGWRRPSRATVPSRRGQGAFPTVLVVQEIFGVLNTSAMCRRLARQGYQAIAPELFQRQGDPAGIDSVADILAKIVSKVPDAQVLADLDACAAWAAANGATRRGWASPVSAGAGGSPGCTPPTIQS